MERGRVRGLVRVGLHWRGGGEREGQRPGEGGSALLEGRWREGGPEACSGWVCTRGEVDRGREDSSLRYNGYGVGLNGEVTMLP